MSIGLLLIPIFFVALIIWVAWPLLAEGPDAKTPVKASNGQAKKPKKRPSHE